MNLTTGSIYFLSILGGTISFVLFCTLVTHYFEIRNDLKHLRKTFVNSPDRSPSVIAAKEQKYKWKIVRTWTICNTTDPYVYSPYEWVKTSYTGPANAKYEWRWCGICFGTKEEAEQYITDQKRREYDRLEYFYE